MEVLVLLVVPGEHWDGAHRRRQGPGVLNGLRDVQHLPAELGDQRAAVAQVTLEVREVVRLQRLVGSWGAQQVAALRVT